MKVHSETAHACLSTVSRCPLGTDKMEQTDVQCYKNTCIGGPMNYI